MPGTIKRPFTAADNYLDYIILNRTHTVTAPTGSGVLDGSLRALWDGRRGSRSTLTVDRNGSNQAQVRVDCAVAKAVNFLWLDAGHNVSGKEAKVQWSDNDSDWTTALTATVGTGGTNMDDGAWAIDVTQSSHRYWRLQFTHATDDVVLSLVFLGKVLYLGNYLSDSARDDSRNVDYIGRSRSRRGVMAFGEKPVVNRFQRGHYRTTLNEYDSGLDDWIAAWFDYGMPVLWCTDWAAHSERMRLYINNASVVDPAWRVPGYREFDLDFIELL